MAEVELRAAGIAAGGEAVAREASGRVVFVRGALPGERVRARIVAEKRDFARAVVTDVVDPSPDRVAPPCPFVAAGCGGCGWQHVAPAAQAALKRRIVTEAMARIGRLPDARVVDGPALDPWGYRTTARLAVGAEGRLGFRRARGHDVVTVDPCAVLHPALAPLLALLRAPGADEVVLRASAATGERVALASPAVPLTVPAGVAVGPDAALTEVVAGVPLRVSAASFFQSRPDGAAALVDLVRDAAGVQVGAAATVVDAYAGVGLFAACVPWAGRVVAVESARSSAADARHNLADRPAAVVRADVARWRPEPADLVVADPPRQGLGRVAAGRLAATGARRLVLVSCDPVSLARDAALLAGLGYRHERSTVVDLFPHTPHVEVVSSFEAGVTA